jgi:hypothetical protein
MSSTCEGASSRSLAAPAPAKPTRAASQDGTTRFRPCENDVTAGPAGARGAEGAHRHRGPRAALVHGRTRNPRKIFSGPSSTAPKHDDEVPEGRHPQHERRGRRRDTVRPGRPYRLEEAPQAGFWGSALLQGRRRAPRARCGGWVGGKPPPPPGAWRGLILKSELLLGDSTP